MNRERAQDILELYRSDNLEDLNDSLIAEALEQLDQDPELSAWFKKQQILDEEISAELNGIAPPSGLKASILNGMYAHAANGSTQAPVEPAESNSGKKASSFPWFRPLMAIAALVVFASVFLALQDKRPASQVADDNSPYNSLPIADTGPVVAGAPDIIQFLGRQIEDFNSSKFNKRSEHVDELKHYLTLAGAPSPAVVPRQLERLPTMGCVSFDYDSAQLSMICFKDGQVYHLITADRAKLRSDCLPELSAAEVHFFEYRNQVFKIWSEGDQIYILTTKGTKKDIADIPEFI